MSDATETYLGDGLYVRAEHDQVVLRAPREDGDHWVALEPAVLGALLAWIEQQGEDTPMGWMLACYIAARAKTPGRGGVKSHGSL